MKISVAMEAYNGMGYISEQIASILKQLGEEDELIISVDPSTDGTEAFLADLSKNDKRVYVLSGPGKGLIANFENAISKTNGDIIFLSDQDDIWLDGKVEKVLTAFINTGAVLVLHDAEIVDGNGDLLGESFFARRGSKPGYWKNLWKNSYTGCCMAFKSELKTLILPFPADIPMHDQWIGILAEKTSSVDFLNKVLVAYRRHGANVSSESHGSITQMLKWRGALIKELRKRVKECPRK